MFTYCTRVCISRFLQGVSTKNKSQHVQCTLELRCKEKKKKKEKEKKSKKSKNKDE